MMITMKMIMTSTVTMTITTKTVTLAMKSTVKSVFFQRPSLKFSH